MAGTPDWHGSDPLIQVAGLHVDHGFGAGAMHAVVDADLALHRGEVLGLAGESGSGKSTLAYAITRLLRQPGIITGGQVEYDGTVDWLSASQHELRGRLGLRHPQALEQPVHRR